MRGVSRERHIWFSREKRIWWKLLGNRKQCPECYPYVLMFRAYIRKYDYSGKAKWIPKGWICEKCNTFVSDER